VVRLCTEGCPTGHLGKRILRAGGGADDKLRRLSKISFNGDRLFAALRPRLVHVSDANTARFKLWSPMPTAKVRASTILGEFEQAHAELIGKAVVLSDGKAGTVDSVWLDDLHGLRISIRGHYGKWPVSTIKFAQDANNRI
jgi:hypothetical protein